jgi:acyl-CoA reductase-like NAD-dependent aldehyde dehydrogenase
MSSSLPLPRAGAVTVELDCGLVVSAGYRTRIAADRLKEAVAKGAKLHIGGVFEGQINQPTILSNVPLDTALANEETFGPVVVKVVDTPEQALEAANRTVYGVTSSILAGNTYRPFELTPKILAGIIDVNSPTANDESHAPMGGVRDIGWGPTGPDSLKEFQRRHLDQLSQWPAPIPDVSRSAALPELGHPMEAPR